MHTRVLKGVATGPLVAEMPMFLCAVFATGTVRLVWMPSQLGYGMELGKKKSYRRYIYSVHICLPSMEA